MQAFDWEALLSFGLVHLKLQPSEFWTLSPAELRMMIGPIPAGSPLGRDSLDSLMAQFPDLAKPNID